MSPNSSLILLGALGLLGAAAPAAAAPAVDTSQWLCKSCPAETGLTATVEAGVGSVSRDSGRFGDYTGLADKGAHLVLGGTLRWRAGSGQWGLLDAADLGLDSRTLSAQYGKEGLYTLRFGYAELPHTVSDSAFSPFAGIGSGVLTLPAGFPAASTGAMPLVATLQPVDIGTTRKRLDLGGSLAAGDTWTLRLDLRHDVRDGTQRSAGSFFANAAQLVAPVDQVTDQLELAAHFRAGRRVQASLAYHASVFRNGQESLTWSNPFSGGPLGGPLGGQLALAPDNQFHQLSGSLGVEITPAVRASADVAVGRMTQDSQYLAATLNPALAVPGLPSVSLDGRARTLNATARLSAQASDALRLHASATRDERHSDSPTGAYPSVSTDLFTGVPRSNLNYDFTRDRFKLGADHRGGPLGLALSAGLEHEKVERTLQEASTTRETGAWVRVTLRPLDKVSTSLKLAHAARDHTSYAAVAAIDPAENPALRKFNMADRTRNAVGVRADIALVEGVSLGLTGDWTNDDYERSAVGLLDGRSVNAGFDLAWAVSDETQFSLYGQEEQIRSHQAGSQLAGTPDWTARSKDAVDLLGVGLKHLALKGKLELGADLTMTRSRSDVIVATGGANPAFPRGATSMDSFKLRASYQLDATTTLYASWWWERYSARDWRLDNVGPASVPNVLLLGETTPRYAVNVVRVGVRYRF